MKTAAVLSHLFPGIVIGPSGDGECSVLQVNGVARIVEWRRQEPQPTDAELQAAEPAALAAESAEAQKQAEYATARDDAKRALSALDTIISSIDAANLVQAKTAIKQLAQIQKRLILATLGR